MRLSGLVCGIVLLAARIVLAQSADSFNPNVNGAVRAIALQPDGRVLIGGSFSQVGTTMRQNIARLNADGSLDTSFNPGAAGEVRAVGVQSDGKIVVGGAFTGLGSGTGATPRANVGRLNADGTVDSAFNPGANFQVLALALQSDGKILVGGNFSLLGGLARGGLGRLNTNGTVDAFNPSVGGLVVFVEAIALHDDGRIVIGGEFDSVGGSARLRIARMSSAGVVDSFNPGASGTVYALAVDNSDRILVGGNFFSVGGGNGSLFARSTIARFPASGMFSGIPDNFDPGANFFVRSIARQADGKILVGGMFTTLGGGGTGVDQRSGLGRLNDDGTIDGAFDPGTNPGNVALAVQPDGRIIVGGLFTTLGGGGTGVSSRNNVGRINELVQPTDNVAISAGGSTITWLRGGGGPDIRRVTFAHSSDGVTYTTLGAGTRLAGGWEITGVSLPSDPNLRLRMRVEYPTGGGGSSHSVVDVIVAAPASNMVENGDFGFGTIGWLTFDQPTGSMGVNVTSGVLQFNRTGTQAVVFQETGLPVPNPAPLVATFQLGNSDTVRKRISILIHDADFSDLAVCTFWLAPGAPLATYTMRTHATEPWANARISLYAAITGAGGFYQVDNVTLSYEPFNSATRTDCVDPNAPAPPGGASSPDLLVNGNFNTGVLAPWATFGQISAQVSSGVLQFLKLNGVPAGTVLQTTSQPLALGQIVSATFQLGSTTPGRQRITVLLHDNDFSDLVACTFWTAPNQPLSNYTVRTYTTKAWTNPTFAIYPATFTLFVHRFDNATLRITPSLATAGTDCLEPGTP